MNCVKFLTPRTKGNRRRIARISRINVSDFPSRAETEGHAKDDLLLKHGEFAPILMRLELSEEPEGFIELMRTGYTEGRKLATIQLKSGKYLHTAMHGRARQLDTADFSYGLTHFCFSGMELAAKCWIITSQGAHVTSWPMLNQ